MSGISELTAVQNLRILQKGLRRQTGLDLSSAKTSSDNLLISWSTHFLPLQILGWNLGGFSNGRGKPRSSS